MVRDFSRGAGVEDFPPVNDAAISEAEMPRPCTLGLPKEGLDAGAACWETCGDDALEPNFNKFSREELACVPPGAVARVGVEFRLCVLRGAFKEERLGDMTPV